MIDFRIWQIAGWTMLHYLWIGSLLGVAAVAVRRLLRSRGANLRYLAAVGCFALLGIAPLPIAVVVNGGLPRPRTEPLVESCAGSGGEAAAAAIAGGGRVFASWGGRARSSPEPGPGVRSAGGRMAPIRARSRGAWASHGCG